ncbi:MAG: hypothetical protein ACLSUZ_05340 [Bifidobacterium pseudocatenulatum]
MDLTKAMVWQSDGNGGNMTATLTNTLKSATLSNVITVQKILEGRDWKAGDSFDFELTADGDAPLPADCAQQAQQSCKVTVAYDADSRIASIPQRSVTSPTTLEKPTTRTPLRKATAISQPCTIRARNTRLWSPLPKRTAHGRLR